MTARERLLKTAREEGGMPVSAGAPSPVAPPAFDLSAAKAKALATARAEYGMPVSAGWVPKPRRR